MLKRIGHCDCRCGRSNVADHAENLVFLKKLLHRFGSTSRLVPVIRSDKPELPAVYPAIGIGYAKRYSDAHLHMLSEFFRGAAERRRNPKPNFSIGYALNGIANGL